MIGTVGSKTANSLVVLTSWILLCLLSLLATSSAALSQNLPDALSNDIVYVHAKEQEGYLDFPGSPLSSTVKVSISYCHIANQSLGNELVYEDLWYSGQNSQDSVGCRRYCDFNIPAKDLVYVYLDAHTPAEIAASANALVRILFDVALEYGAISNIQVPSASFKPLINQLQHENFFPLSDLSEFLKGDIFLPLVADDSSQRLAVYFNKVR